MRGLMGDELCARIVAAIQERRRSAPPHARLSARVRVVSCGVGFDASSTPNRLDAARESTQAEPNSTPDPQGLRCPRRMGGQPGG